MLELKQLKVGFLSQNEPKGKFAKRKMTNNREFQTLPFAYFDNWISTHWGLHLLVPEMFDENSKGCI